MTTTIDLTGRSALVTGASRGIGREAAIRLAAAGASVAINYHRSEAEAAELAGRIGGKAFVVRADVSRPQEVESMVGEVAKRFGTLDILVNNAATFERNPFEGDSYEHWQGAWRRTFELNVFGAANAAFLAARVMRRQGGGKIINIASRAAFRGELEFPDYGASKAALVNLTISMARACARDNIVSSCIAPGFIETDMARSELEAHYDDIVSQIPLGRVGSAGDVAGLILFLASGMGDYLNGSIIDVNGGSWFH